jgi:hypothetical protein
MLTHGVYHRNEATHQTAADAESQVKSNEIWGRTPWNGFEPTVQAYRPLGIKQERRIEFSTDVKPGAESPYEAWWYRSDPGVQTRHKDGETFACIAVEVSLNTQV